MPFNFQFSKTQENINNKLHKVQLLDTKVVC